MTHFERLERRMRSDPANEYTHPIKGTVISPDYTVILRDGALEFYAASNGPWEKRNAPDFLLTSDETESLFDFLLLIPPAQHTKTNVFENSQSHTETV